ncbi:MAG: NAD(P)H-hydrate dehydratase [Lachnospiraceae bacterium]|nr:NAD(P)H-hydrate dehydratase [Lachnospiraceae bacterium]
MRYIYTSEQAKAIDTHAIGTLGFPGLVLMEKAAMALAAVIMENETPDKTVLCVCGMGNNGGDGVAVSRILRQAGFTTAVCPVGDPEKMSRDMKKQMELALSCHVPVVKIEAISEFDIIVDAIFGIGLTKPVQGVFDYAICLINESRNYVYAADIPSGIHGTSGKIMGNAVIANETVTFGEHKVGMILYPGCEFAGKITVADIGFPLDSVATITNPAYIYETEDIFRLPVRPAYSNKGTFGKVLVIAGSEHMSGACYLAAKAAYTMGVGLVKVLTTENNRNIILQSLPEVLFSTEKTLAAELEWADVIVIGPGLGRDERAKRLLEFVTEHSEKPTVIDGDGIFLLGEKSLSENFILTPHLKEMTYLSGQTVEDIKEDLLGMAKQTAREKGYVLVLKDSRSVVSNGEEIYINVSGNNGMATGGSGDVLAGTIAGLLAGELRSFEAAKLGVYLHGLAGDCMVLKKGHYGLLASDLITGLCEVTREIGGI